MNTYLPFASKIVEVIKHTPIEYTFRMAYRGDVKPGQFFEVSLPKFGEAPISVSGITEDLVDLTIRKVGKVTNEIFENYVGDTLWMRGPYGNGFDVEHYRGSELLIMAGGTGLSPVRGVMDYFARNIAEVQRLTLIAGFKSAADILFFEDIGRWRKTADVILTVDTGESTPQYHIGLVTEYIPGLKFKDVSQAKAIVVGPPPMMRFSTAGLLTLGFQSDNIWVSHERKMCCGIGKCGHCKIGDSYVCLDGPVFTYTKGISLVD